MIHTPWGGEMDQRIAADVLQQEYDPLELPAFSTSWGGMALLVSHLRERAYVSIMARPKDYLVELPASNGWDTIQVVAETAPLAVCQAALAQRDLVLATGNYLSVRQAIIRRDGLECYYCGSTVRFAVEVQSAVSALSVTVADSAEYERRATELKREKMVIGHKVPPSWGGTDFIENLVIAHAYCHKSQGKRNE